MGTRRRECIPHYESRDGVRRHVWIFGGDPTAPYPWPGLLVEWQRREDGWWARCVFVPYPASVGELAEAWLPAESIRPAPEP